MHDRPWSRTNRLILAAAANLGVEAEPLGSEHSDFFLRLRWPEAPEGPRAVLISKTRSPYLTEVAQTLANNKFLSRELLAGRGVPTVPSLLLDDDADPRRDPATAARARDFLGQCGALAVKPNWGNRGLGVVTEVRDFAALARAYAHARDLDRDEEVVLEPMLRGVNLRVAVIGGQAVAAAEIRRPMLRGDGRSTIQALLETLNADPRRGSWRRPALTSLDQIETEDLEARLAASNLSLEQVPAPGQELEISFEELEVIDRSDELHGHWLALAAEAARLLGARVHVSGIRPALARALVELGVELPAAAIVRSVREALRRLRS